MQALGTLNILGTTYTVISQSERENSKLVGNDGLCEYYSKKLLIDNITGADATDLAENIGEYWKSVVRHEALHAIFHEAGLEKYQGDETLITALALLYPKINAIMKECDEIGEQL